MMFLVSRLSDRTRQRILEMFLLNSEMQAAMQQQRLICISKESGNPARDCCLEPTTSYCREIEFSPDLHSITIYNIY